MTIRITWKRIVLALLAAAAAALLVSFSGVITIAASSGHWAITDWFLHWTMRNSVRTHAFFEGEKTPIARDGDLVSAAGHFAAACASCHGAPGLRPSPVMQKATPPAPDLTRLDPGKYSDGELNYILTHGVKMTGMPAWGSAHPRPDEVRRMVAFVRLLPRLDAAGYRALSGAATGAGKAGVAGIAGGTVEGCVACHGSDGRGRGQRDIPVLGGQDPAYLARALADYAAGRRASAVMQNAAARLTAAEREALARHFAAMPGLSPSLGVPPAGDARAAALVTRGNAAIQLPACVSCHAPGKRAPVLAGQRPAYLAQRLRDWRGEKEVVDARKPQEVMPVIARRIPEEMIDPIARYLAGQRTAAR